MPIIKATIRIPTTTMHPSERPSVTGGIHGDGNCFFRSMPFLVTGVQQHHSQLQNACTTYMDAHKGCFEALAQCRNYIDQSKMKYNGTWLKFLPWSEMRDVGKLVPEENPKRLTTGGLTVCKSGPQVLSKQWNSIVFHYSD